MRVPKPAAGMITTTFIAGCKYTGPGAPVQMSEDRSEVQVRRSGERLMAATPRSRDPLSEWSGIRERAQHQPRPQIYPTRAFRLRLPNFPTAIYPIVVWIGDEVELCGTCDCLLRRRRRHHAGGRHTKSVESRNLGGGHGKLDGAIKIKSPEVVLNLFASASSSL